MSFTPSILYEDNKFEYAGRGLEQMEMSLTVIHKNKGNVPERRGTFSFFSVPEVPVFKSPVGGKSFIEGLDDIFMSLNLNTEVISVADQFFRAVINNKMWINNFVCRHFKMKNSGTVLAENTTLNMREVLKKLGLLRSRFSSNFEKLEVVQSLENVKGSSVNNMFHRVQANPLNHFVAFCLYTYEMGSVFYSLYYGGMLRDPITERVYFTKKGYFVAVNAAPVKSTTPYDVQRAMERYEDMHGHLFESCGPLAHGKKLLCRYPINYAQFGQKDYYKVENESLTGIPRFSTIKSFTPLGLVIEHGTRTLASRCRGAAIKIWSMALSPLAMKEIDEDLIWYFKKMWGLAKEPKLSPSKIIAASQELEGQAMNWAEFLWSTSESDARLIVSARFSGNLESLSPEQVVIFERYDETIDEALACGVGLLFCSLDVVNIENFKRERPSHSLTPKKRPRSQGDEPVGFKFRKTGAHMRGGPVLFQCPHAKDKSVWIELSSSNWTGPLGTIFWENGDTRKDLRIPEKMDDQLKFLQHVCAFGGNIKIFYGDQERKILLCGSEAKVANLPSNCNANLRELLPHHDIKGTVFKFDDPTDAYD